MAEAEAILSDDSEIPDRDRLLYFMAKGLILHDLGRYEDSSRELLAASRLMERQELISMSQETASLVTSDQITDYKGEYAERLWVHTYLMMNFLVQYQYDSALVEARQAMKLFKKYPEALDQEVFTRALIALCFENVNLFNDAYIEYKKLPGIQNMPSAAPLMRRLAALSGLGDEAETWRRMIPAGMTADPPHRFQPELVLFIGSGKGPVKIESNIVLPPSIRLAFPQYQPRDPGISRIQIQGVPSSQIMRFSTDLNAVAEASLNARAAQMTVKLGARAAIKEAISQAVGHKNDDAVEFIVRAALFLMENADVRCWETLPASLTLVRVPIPPQIRSFTVEAGAGGKSRSEEIRMPEPPMKPGQRIFRSIRLK